MLKTRIIPTLLWKDVGLVKGVGFDSWRRVDTVLPAVKVYNMREVDELIIVDITASKEGREPDYESISEFSEECFVPLTIGGGIKTVEHVRWLLKSGADKVSINTYAFENPSIISDAADKFGSQCVVGSIDAKKDSDGKYYCYSFSGSKKTQKEVISWAKDLEKLGAGEILITSIERDGSMLGYDIELIKQVSDNVNIPVIASGGAGNYEDMYKAIVEGKASAIAAASIYHFTEQTPKEAKKYLANKGILVRN
jgi:cyclase